MGCLKKITINFINKYEGLSKNTVNKFITEKVVSLDKIWTNVLQNTLLGYRCTYPNNDSMIRNISGSFLLEALLTALSGVSQCRKWNQYVFLLARILFLGRTRIRMLLNPKSKADVDRQEFFCRLKTIGSKAKCSTGRYRESFHLQIIG